MRIREYVTLPLVGLALGILLACALAVSISAQEPGISSNRDLARRAQTQLLESSTDRIVFTVQIPEYLVAQKMVDGKAYDIISIPDWGLTAEVGAPQLPMRRLLLGIPLGAEVQLRVVGTTKRVHGPHDVLPAPETVLLTIRPSTKCLGPLRQNLRCALPRHLRCTGPMPSIPKPSPAWARWGFIRHQRVAAIELSPVQYNPASGEVRYHPRRSRFELTFSYPLGRQAVQPPAPEGEVYELLLQNQLLNYASAKARGGGRRSRRPRNQPGSQRPGNGPCSPWPTRSRSRRMGSISSPTTSCSLPLPHPSPSIRIPYRCSGGARRSPSRWRPAGRQL